MQGARGRSRERTAHGRCACGHGPNGTRKRRKERGGAADADCVEVCGGLKQYPGQPLAATFEMSSSRCGGFFCQSLALAHVFFYAERRVQVGETASLALSATAKKVQPSSRTFSRETWIHVKINHLRSFGVSFWTRWRDPQGQWLKDESRSGSMSDFRMECRTRSESPLLEPA